MPMELYLTEQGLFVRTLPDLQHTKVVSRAVKTWEPAAVALLTLVL